MRSSICSNVSPALLSSIRSSTETILVRLFCESLAICTAFVLYLEGSAGCHAGSHAASVSTLFAYAAYFDPILHTPRYQIMILLRCKIKKISPKSAGRRDCFLWKKDFWQ